MGGGVGDKPKDQRLRDMTKNDKIYKQTLRLSQLDWSCQLESAGKLDPHDIEGAVHHMSD